MLLKRGWKSCCVGLSLLSLYVCSLFLVAYPLLMIISHYLPNAQFDDLADHGSHLITLSEIETQVIDFKNGILFNPDAIRPKNSFAAAYHESVCTKTMLTAYLPFLKY